MTESAPKPTRAQQRREEEFERLCATGWTVCCGGGSAKPTTKGK